LVAAPFLIPSPRRPARATSNCESNVSSAGPSEVVRRNQLVAAIRAVSDGGLLIDPKVVEGLVAHRARATTSPLNELTTRERLRRAEAHQGGCRSLPREARPGTLSRPIDSPARGQALSAEGLSHSSTASIGIIRNSAWVPACATPVRRATNTCSISPYQDRSSVDDSPRVPTGA
jgi:hypothetical protein